MSATAKNPMPTDLEEMFDIVHKKLCRIYLEWNLYRELFADSEDRIALLNKTAKTFFRSLQIVLQDSVYLGLTRMTDPAKSKFQDNLTLRQLVEKVRGLDPLLFSGVETAVTNAERICQPFRSHRNKRIAHNDLRDSIKGNFVRPSRQDVEIALKSIEDVMNIFHRHFSNTEYRYKNIIYSGGGDALDCYLRAGVYFHELRRRVALGELVGNALANEIRSYSL